MRPTADAGARAATVRQTRKEPFRHSCLRALPLTCGVLLLVMMPVRAQQQAADPELATKSLEELMNIE